MMCGPPRNCPRPMGAHGAASGRSPPRSPPRSPSASSAANGGSPKLPSCLTRSPPSPTSSAMLSMTSPQSRVGDRSSYIVTRSGLPDQGGYRADEHGRLARIGDASNRSVGQTSTASADQRARLLAVRSPDQQKTFPWVSVPVPLQDSCSPSDSKRSWWPGGRTPSPDARASVLTA